MRNVIGVFLKAAVLAAVICAGAFGAPRLFAGDYRTLPFGPGGVCLTNSQANSVWCPTAVLFNFGLCPTGLVSVARLSRGVEFGLSPAVGPGVTNAVWCVPCDFPFKFGDVLVVYSGGGTGVVQVMTKAGN